MMSNEETQNFVKTEEEAIQHPLHSHQHQHLLKLQLTAPTKVVNNKNHEKQEKFWDNIYGLRIVYFAIAVWCVGWNSAGTWISPTQWQKFVPLILFGICFMFSAIHCRYVYRKHVYRSVALLVIFAGSYAIIGLLFFWSNFVLLIDSYATSLERRNTPKKVMHTGNLFLTTFIIYVNICLIKQTAEQVLNEIDQLKTDLVNLEREKISAAKAPAIYDVLHAAASQKTLDGTQSVPYCCSPAVRAAVVAVKKQQLASKLSSSTS